MTSSDDSKFPKRTLWMFTLVCGAAAALLISTARQKSLVYDEVIYAPAGYIYWKTGDLRVNIIHPPLQKYISALPWLKKSLPIPELSNGPKNEWHLGHQIIFSDLTRAKELIRSARGPSIIVTLLSLMVIFIFGCREFGAAGAVVATAALAFDPLVLGNGALAMNDIFVTFFYLLGFVVTLEFLKGRRTAGDVGLVMGCAIVSKFSGVLMMPAAAALILWPSKDQSSTYSRRVISLLVMGAVAALIVLAIYRFRLSLIGAALFKESLVHHQINEGFLLGAFPGNRPWIYNPVALLIKTPIALLTLWATSLTILVRRSAAKPYLIFAGMVWLSACVARNHFGLRYLLPATPILALAIGDAFSRLQRREHRLIFVTLLGWLAVEAVFTHPNHLAYFNELVGGSSQGYKWLDGSNQDWGQDLPALADFMRAHPRASLLLGYYGSDAPEAWGLSYQDVFSPAIHSSYHADLPNAVDVPEEFIAVSARLIGHNDSRAVYAWLHDRKPVAFLGDTLFVFDITSDRQAAEILAELYRQMGRTALAEREEARARFISSRPNGAERTADPSAAHPPATLPPSHT